MTNHDLLKNPQFLDFVREVNRQLAELQPEAASVEARLIAELHALQQKMSGWMESLSKRDLPLSLRTAVEQQYDEADGRARQLETELQQVRHAENTRERLAAPEVVAERLLQQGELLAANNASALNLLLSQHIEGIHCDSEGRACVRLCKLGALGGAIDIVPRDPGVTTRPSTATPAQFPARPRRRARLNPGDAIDDEEEVASANNFAVDPQRFGGLGEEWFTETVLEPPVHLSWAQQHARAVAEYRLQTHCSMAKAGKHFGKSKPTIHAALVFARDTLGIDALGKTVSRPTLVNWPRENAAQVRAFFAQDTVSMADAVAHFEKSAPTIKKALKLTEPA